MSRRAEYVRQRRRQAWAYGREVRDGLLVRYCEAYGISVAPPPALIIDELLTDFLHVKLHYDPLNTDVFAQTGLQDGVPVVTVNSLTGSIPGVRDGPGVQNVGKWHEAIHVVDDLDTLRPGASVALPGFDVPRKIVCYRSGESRGNREAAAREFWAEEAGRAAAVSFEALARSTAFQTLFKAAPKDSGPVAQGFPLLYEAAEDIGVNITALVKQLTLEGLIVITKESGRATVCIQPRLEELVGVG
jgi:hypothetical protein